MVVDMFSRFLAALVCVNLIAGITPAQDDAKTWKFRSEALQPLWQSKQIEGESVLFLREADSAIAKASVLFPIAKVVSITNSRGDQTFEEGKDFQWSPNSRELTIPVGSRIPIHTHEDLRRPAKSQPYELTHRDGQGEIRFGARLEYADMQVCVTYQPTAIVWNYKASAFDPKQLPKTIAKLRSRSPFKFTVLGDSISTGANASGVFGEPPFQPGYPDLVQMALAKHYNAAVEMKNLSVGGMDTAWGLSQAAAVIDTKPDLVIIAFGMNDSAGRTPEDYQEKIKLTMKAISDSAPETEYILVATMLGNKDWIRLNHDYFPKYRDALVELAKPGVVVADCTSVWQEMLSLKKDWDLSGNGVNHPNDFGHRVYAQVILSTLR